ncbi:MAG: hypothetical protein COA85_03370 [Robiginitomaculum sp.]|nr:MAG: hypothetical protein COA85_03370 [Robiginitomaculum sp.]
MDFTQFLPYCADLYSASSLDELVTSFDRVIKHFGLDRHCLFEISSVETAWQEQLIIGTFPDGYLSDFWREQRAFDSVIIRQVKLSGVPFLTADLHQNYDLTTKERDVESKAQDAGIFVGITFPLKGRHNRIAGVVITGDPAVLGEQEKWILTCIIAGYYSRACVLYEMTNPKINDVTKYALTKRERECLTFVAMGKADREVAEMLNISERTVIFHVNNAKNKLGTNTRLQAVLMALRNVEIFL